MTPLDALGGEKNFHIDPGEPVSSIATRLEQEGIISSAKAFYAYLVYTGYDLTLRAGDHRLSPAFSIIDIAKALQDATPAEATLVILPGWRMEEIATSLPTSGLNIAPQEFLSAAQYPPSVLGLPSGTMEGYFFPDSYQLSRDTNVNMLLEVVARNFMLHISPEMREGFAGQGLTLPQAVILASIIEREAVQDQELPLIASVFLNRLNIGMTLGSDPTIQYALGYDSLANSWWKNPLILDDLKVDSPYNTYLQPGLPPAPIANPSLAALRAVAFPDTSPFYYFQAACDGSGYHTFTISFEEHLANRCP